ncbi:MAG: universal stress protein, partial [Pseudomonadota bacterium]
PEPAVTAEDLPGARLSRHAAPGDPATEILGRLAEVGPDLLVLISEGRRGVVDMLYGSITEQVLRAAQTPVLVVPAR